MAKKRLHRTVVAMRDLDGLKDRYREILIAAARNAPKDAPIVEVGSYHGRSVIQIARAARHAGHEGLVYAVEPHHVFDSSTGILHVKPRDRFFFYKNIAESGLAHKIALIALPSVQAAQAFEPESIGMLFLDACHEYPDVRQDLDVWLSKLQAGCTAIGDDYADNYPGCKQAWDEEIASGRLVLVDQVARYIVCRKT